MPFCNPSPQCFRFINWLIWLKKWFKFSPHLLPLPLPHLTNFTKPALLTMYVSFQKFTNYVFMRAYTYTFLFYIYHLMRRRFFFFCHKKQLCHCHCQIILEHPEPQQVSSSVHTCVSIVDGRECVRLAHHTSQHPHLVCVPSILTQSADSWCLSLWDREGGIDWEREGRVVWELEEPRVWSPSPESRCMHLGLIRCAPSWPTLFSSSEICCPICSWVQRREDFSVLLSAFCTGGFPSSFQARGEWNEMEHTWQSPKAENRIPNPSSPLTERMLCAMCWARVW